MRIRWLIRRDLPEVLEVEKKESFLPRWKEKDFLKCLRGKNCIPMVAVEEEVVVGFLIYELHKNKLEILRMAGNTEAIHLFIDKLKGKLTQDRRNRLDFVVPLRNLPLLQQLRCEKFIAIDKFDEFWENCEEEAVKMEYTCEKTCEIM